MKVQGRERVPFGFIKVLEPFWKNGEAIESNSEIEIELREIEKNESGYKEVLEERITSKYYKARGRRNASMSVRTPAKRAVARQAGTKTAGIDDKERE